MKKSEVLEHRYRRFAQEYIIDFSPGRAYERTGYKAKGRSADAQGCTLLKKPEVQEYVKEEIEARKKRLELDQDIIILEHLRIALSDIRNYMEWDEGGLTWKSSDDLTEDQSRSIGSVEFIENVGEYSTNRRFKFKLHNKNTALDALSRHLGLYDKDNKRYIEDNRESVKDKVHQLISQTKSRLENSLNGSLNGATEHDN